MTSDHIPVTNVGLVLDKTGATDVGSALQTIIDNDATAHRRTYIPAGLYLIGGTRIRIPSGARILGDGWDRSVLLRDVNSAQGTVEVFNASDVEIDGIGIKYSPSDYTAGYQQTGFCVRNGSQRVKLLNCGVVGKINRAFHILNSAHVEVIAPITIGSGNAGLRVVCDFAAKIYLGMTDEVNPIQVREIWIDRGTFVGATTLFGSTRAGTSYGVNLATESGSLDYMQDVWVTNCIVRYTDHQGFSNAGKGRCISFDNCHAEFVGVNPTLRQGIGFYPQIYGGNFNQRVSYIGCKAYYCGYGFFLNDVFDTTLEGCHAAGCADGFCAFNARRCKFIGCSTENGLPGTPSGTYGFFCGGDSRDINFAGCTASGVATGMYAQNTTSYFPIAACSSRQNTVSQYGFNGTGHAAAGNV